MKVIITFTFCCNNLRKNKYTALKKSPENSGNFFSHFVAPWWDLQASQAWWVTIADWPLYRHCKIPRLTTFRGQLLTHILTVLPAHYKHHRKNLHHIILYLDADRTGSQQWTVFLARLFSAHQPNSRTIPGFSNMWFPRTDCIKASNTRDNYLPLGFSCCIDNRCNGRLPCLAGVPCQHFSVFTRERYLLQLPSNVLNFNKYSEKKNS